MGRDSVMRTMLLPGVKRGRRRALAVFVMATAVALAVVSVTRMETRAVASPAPRGAAWDWGNKALGQLVNGTITSSSSPVAVNVSSGTVVTAIAAGNNHSLAVTSTGRVLAWGSNT